MGQQQLLLLVMGLVIVGLAVVAGFQMAEVSMKQHDADVMVGRCISIASDAIYWKTKNDPYTPGGAEYSSLIDAGMAQLFVGEETENAEYWIDPDGFSVADQVVFVAVSKRFPEVGVRVTVVGDTISKTEVDFSGEIDNPTD
ncbi:MAG: hypothetical protein SH809_07675 [Rhodothermales bacterium]|nr:hypothetical protein [Rhodothermales bacterium]